jgi:NodT family efflux transporter outer membrane factor (OMF) lipoprotein
MKAPRTFAPLVVPAVLGAVAALGGCTVGPAYQRPQVATPSAYAEAAVQTPSASDASLARWWDRFNDPTLASLIDHALANNLDLQAAASRVREARLQEVSTRAGEYPNVNAIANAASVQSNRGGGSLIPSDLNLFAVGFDATWEVDLFGGTRRALEAAKADTQAATWARRDGEVSLTAEVANDYLTLRALQARIALGQSEIQRQQSMFGLIYARRQAGFVTQLDVNRQTGEVESASAQIPALQADATAEIHALGVLLGETPEALEKSLAVAAPIPPAPPSLPAGLPSELLRRRPDLREAERRVAANNARVGAQIANLYPRLNLIGFGAFAGTALQSLFSSSNLIGAAVGMAAQPVFDAGRRHAAVDIAREQTTQSVLAYRTTVLGALRDVEDALSRYNSEQTRNAALARALDAAKNSQSIAQDEYKTGFVTFIDVLQAQTALLEVQDQLTQSDALVLTDLVALYKALGGGWST